MEIAAETPVCDIAVALPTAIPALEHFGIDYCCGGTHTLAEACNKCEVNIALVLEELERLARQSLNPADTQWQYASMKDLTDHIVRKHHAFTRDQLGLLRDLEAKVERRNGDKYPKVFQVSEALAAITTELEHHFFCEENILFPYIAQLGGEQQPALPSVFGSVQQPVTRMILDHDHTGGELRRLREITNNYLPPEDACTTYRALYRALEDLEQDLHRHIHLENNILFPRALDRAAKVA